MKCKKCMSDEGRGETNLCRKCWRREYDRRNKEKIREQHTKNYLDNRKQRLGLINKWRDENKKEIADQKREYYKKNKIGFIEKTKNKILL